MNQLPKTWWTDELDGGSRVLVGKSSLALHLLAPPGVRCRSGEPDEERVLWRHAMWISEDEEDPPAARVDVPDDVTCMQTSEVVELLPSGHHDFVRRAMARQISRAVLFGLPLAGAGPDERHAREAGRTLAWVTGQLADAFPSEAWFRPAIAPARIPATADELLEKLPAEALEERRRMGDLLNGVHRRLFDRRRGTKSAGFFSWQIILLVVVSARLCQAFGPTAGSLKAATPRQPEGPEPCSLDDLQVH